MKLIDFNHFHQLQKLEYDELIELSQDIRNYIIDIVTKNNGHLSSNLGVVELTISLLRNFDLDNKDIIMFDTGHQAYTYKILTDRKEQFKSLRTKNGMSGFQSIFESKYDYITNGHAATALPTALGYALSQQYNNIVVVLGDATFDNGLTWESLNFLLNRDIKIIIVLNDNEMSITKSSNIVHIKKIKELIEAFNLKYYGLIDGHDLKALDNAINLAKHQDKSSIIHIKTIKGKGYYENEKVNHSFSINLNDKNKEWSYFVANHLQQVFETRKFFYVGAAMHNALYFDVFHKINPSYCYDVGLAEELAVLVASGLSLAKQKVVVNLYSTFLLRTYDQIWHDIIRQQLPVIFLIDRANLAIADGTSHHGIYDIGMLLSYGDVVILAEPANDQDFIRLYDLALDNTKYPFFIRYPRFTLTRSEEKQSFKIGQWDYVKQNNNSEILFIAYGNVLNELIAQLKDNQTSDIINARFINPIDHNILNNIANNNEYKKIIIIEKTIKSSCLYTNILLNYPQLANYIDHYAYNNGLIEHETIDVEKIVNNYV